MDDEFVVFGAKGYGSVAVEATLTLIGARYRTEDGIDHPINPMRQVPALLRPSGELVTESAAILIGLAEEFPAARLAPRAGEPSRVAFLRWMAFASSAIYALFWIADEPSRLIDDQSQHALMQTRLWERIASCWGVMEAQTKPGRYLLGESLTVLDLYVTVLSRWEPHRWRFYEVAPRMGEVVRRVDGDPRLAALWAKRFPFEAGWEG